MTRRLTLLFAAFEALLVFGIGIAIPLVPLTLMWAGQYGFAPDWAIFWRAAVDVWLLGHGVDLRVTLDPVTAASLGQPVEQTPVFLTMALLGFALLTLLLGVRAGGRVAETGHRMFGGLIAIIVFGGLSVFAALSALDEAARPSLVQSALLPAGVFALGLLAGVLRAGAEAREGAGVEAAPGSLRDRIADWPVRVANWPVRVRATVAAALRGGAAAAAITLALSAVAVAVLLVANYAQLIRLYEGLHAGAVGGLALTAGQLALLPNLVIWAASWFVGPGFALGSGSSVSPLGTVLGPVPAVPVLGALPPGDLDYAFVGLLVPVLAGFFGGVAVNRSLQRGLGDYAPWYWTLLTALGGGAVGGLALGLLAWASAGSAGPGRLLDVGPDPLLVGGIAAIEFALAIGIGLLLSRVGRPVTVGVPRQAEPDSASAPAATASGPAASVSAAAPASASAPRPSASTTEEDAPADRDEAALRQRAAEKFLGFRQGMREQGERLRERAPREKREPREPREKREPRKRIPRGGSESDRTDTEPIDIPR